MPMPGPHNVSVSKIGLGWPSALSLGGALGLGWPGEGGLCSPVSVRAHLSFIPPAREVPLFMCKFGPVSDPLLWPLLLL